MLDLITIKRRKGVTLIELLIAVALLSLVFLAATSVDIASRSFSISTSRQAGVQNEARLAMEHMARNIREGVSANVPTPNRIRVNLPGGNSLRYRQTGSTIRYRPPGGPWRVIARDITNLDFTLDSNALDFVTIEITAQDGDQNITLTSLVTLRNS